MQCSTGNAISSITAQLTRLPHKPTLVAVSKYHPVSAIFLAYNAGQRDFGENYIQELKLKSAQMPLDVRWHYIGVVHSNQCKALAEIKNLAYIHTITSIKHATSINEHRSKSGHPPIKVLIQVNTSEGESKSGLPPFSQPDPNNVGNNEAELMVLARHIVQNCTCLQLSGLMTIGSIDESKQSESTGQNSDFTSLLSCRDTVSRLLNVKGLQTSMGMSSDYMVAAGMGSDFVRIGSKIFGDRPVKD